MQIISDLYVESADITYVRLEKDERDSTLLLINELAHGSEATREWVTEYDYDDFQYSYIMTYKLLHEETKQVLNTVRDTIIVRHTRYGEVFAIGSMMSIRAFVQSTN